MLYTIKTVLKMDYTILAVVMRLTTRTVYDVVLSVRHTKKLESL